AQGGANPRAYTAAHDQPRDDRAAFPNDRNDDDGGQRGFGAESDQAVTGLQRKHDAYGCARNDNQQKGFRSYFIELADQLSNLIGRPQDRTSHPAAKDADLAKPFEELADAICANICELPVSDLSSARFCVDVVG